MKKGKFVKRTVLATTTNKQKSIINFLLMQGHSASRINTMGIWSKEKEQYIHGGGRVGHSDISGVFKSRFYFPTSQSPIGIAFFIEGKWTKTDTLSVEQIEFREEVKKAGAFYLECDSIERFQDWYKIIKQNYL